MKLLLLGASGQLGRAFTDLSKTDAFPIGWILTPLDRNALDYSKPETLEARILLEKPDVILNCAAYTSVDLAESETELAMKVNADSPGVLARVAKRTGAILVHYSSDYV